jgi:hypothetical protein
MNNNAYMKERILKNESPNFERIYTEEREQYSPQPPHLYFSPVRMKK